MSKQRFEQAAAFFLLAGSLLDAVAVCVHQLNDIQLAIVISRMYEGDTERGPTVRYLLNRYMLGRSSDLQPTMKAERPSSDVFLKSIALWMLKEYPAALDTLVEGDRQPGQDAVDVLKSPAVYNFYLYLRKHPFVLRRGTTDNKSRNISSGLLGAPATGIVQSKKVALSQTDFTKRLTGVGDEPLTLAEKHLLFSAAYSQLNAGCPMLALDVLSHLPTVAGEDENEDESEVSVQGASQEHTDHEHADGMQPDKSGDIDWSQSVSNVVSEDKSDAFDWSQPVSVAGSPQKSIAFDWSQPLARQELDGYEGDPFDLCQQVSSLLDHDRDESAKGASAFQDAKTEAMQHEGHSKKDETPTCSPVALTVASQMKFHGCVAMLIDQFRSLPVQARHQVGLSSTGQPMQKGIMSEAKSGRALRSLFSRALRNELAILQDYCKLKTDDEVVKVHSNFYGIGDTQSLAHLLLLLIHYCSLHGAAGSGLLPLQMESIILLQDSVAFQSPLEPPLQRLSEMPPLCLSALNVLPSHISPCHLIQAITDDLIQHIIACKELPSSRVPLQHLNVMKNLTNTLSVCVLQCTSANRSWQQERDSERLGEFSEATFQLAGEERLRSPTVRSYVREQMEKVDSDIQPQARSKRWFPSSPPFGKRKRSAHVSEADLTVTQLPVRPTSNPCNWPGVKEWPTSLESAEKSPGITFSVLLGEATVAICLALLAIAASEHKAEDLLLLLINSPSAVMWGRTFGGGAKTSQSLGGLNISESFIEKSASLGGSPLARRRRTSRSKGTAGADAKELFVSPQISLMEHFVTPVSPAPLYL